MINPFESTTKICPLAHHHPYRLGAGERWKHPLLEQMQHHCTSQPKDCRDGDPSGSCSTDDLSSDDGDGVRTSSSAQSGSGDGRAPLNAVYPGSRSQKPRAHPRSHSSLSSGDAGSFPSNYTQGGPVTRCRRRGAPLG